MKKKYIKISLMLFILLSQVAVRAQDTQLKSYSGVVINSKGEAIEHVGIYAQDSRTSSISDKDGKFSLNISPGESIICTKNGYFSSAHLTTALLATDTFTIYELGSKNQNDQVQLSHYALPFERITGAVERITGEELSDYPTIYLQEALAGRLSGLTSSYDNANPINESFMLSTRGGESVSFVDGAPIDITETTSEIDNIIVAKDFGSSFALGSRNHTGALLLNTKRGEVGNKYINIGVRQGIRDAAHTQDMMDAATYAKYFNMALENEGQAPFYSSDDIKGYELGNDTVKYPDNNYAKDLMSDKSKYTHLTGDFAGGNKNATYYSHVGVYTTNGIESTPNQSSLARLRTKNNVQMHLNDYTGLEVGVAASYKKVDGPFFTGDRIFNIHSSYPSNAFPYVIGQQNNDVIYGNSKDFPTNPYGELTKSDEYESTIRDVNTRLAIDFDLSNIMEGLKINTLYNFYAYNRVGKITKPSYSVAERYYVQGENGEEMLLRNYTIGEDSPDWEEHDSYNYRSQFIKSSIDYNQTFDSDHSIIASLFIDNTKITGSEIPLDQVYRNYGAYANYMYQDLFVIDASALKPLMRSQLSKKNQGFNYTAGAAVLLHHFAWLKEAKSLDLLKARINYGERSLAIDSYHISTNLYGTTQAGTFGVDRNPSTTTGNYRSYTQAKDLKLPRQSYLSLGLDYSLFQGIISGQANYYEIEQKDHIETPDNIYAIFSSDAAYLPEINYGHTKQSGFDARLRYADNIKDFRWVVDANILYNKTYVYKENSIDMAQEERSRIDNYDDRILGLDYNGLFQTVEDVENSNHRFSPVQIGDARYKDYNNDNVVDEKDYHEIGHEPRIFYGLNFLFGFKNLTLSAHFDGVADGEYLDDRYINKGFNAYPQGMANYMDNPNMPRVTVMSNPNNSVNSTLWLKEASFLNFRSLYLQYTVPQKVLSKMLIKSAKIHVAGKNLKVFSSNDDVYMPMRSAGYSTHPIMDAYELGITVGF